MGLAGILQKDIKKNIEKINGAEKNKMVTEQKPIETAIREASVNDFKKITDGVLAVECEINDPRPEFKEDSWLWLQLLGLAYDLDKKLAWILHGFRCHGSAITKGTSGGYVIRPRLGPESWTDQQEYNVARDRYLRPYVKEIGELLKKLFVWEEHGYEHEIK